MQVTRPRLHRVVAAFAVAPLGGASFVAAVMLALALYLGRDAVPGQVVGLSFIVTAGVGYAVAVVLGIPGFLLFRRLRWIRGSHWVLLCATVGTAAGAALPVGGALFGNGREIIWAALGAMAAAGTLVGAASGLLFARTIRTAPPAAGEIAATFD